jgi:LuxR family maltose regulon positive regulatory protein
MVTLVPSHHMTASGAAVLQTKLVPPPSRPGIIPRPTLTSKLAGITTPIVVVSAPAGFGKSTSVAQWAAQDARPVAWLSLDARDNDAYVLLSYLHVALDAIAPMPPDVGVAIASAAPSIWTSAVPRLGAAIASCGRVVVVLDDFDRVTDPDGTDAILSLSDHLPPGAQLVLVGRTEGRLPVPRLIAESRVSVVGVTDLVFDDDETATILRDAGIVVPPADIERITGHLEGWPAGVYLTARSLQAGGRLPLVANAQTRQPDTAEGPSLTHLAGEYLRTELLERLDADDLAFALRTSVLERLTGELCDAVVERSDSAARLRSWERSNLFLIPLDSDHLWYRYHHLLHDVLAVELQRREPRVIPELHRRAAAWSVAQGFHEQAFEHDAAADEVAAAAKLLPGLLQRAWNAGRVDTALRWADWFESTPEFDQHVEALAAGSFMLRHLGEATRADRWSDTAEHWHPDPDDATAVHGSALRHLGRAFGMRSGPERMLDDAERAVDGLDAMDPWLIPALSVLGVAQYLSGHDVDAAVTLDRAIDEATARNASPTAASIGAAIRAVVSIDRDDWAAAERSVRVGQEMVAANHLGEHSPGIAIDAVAARVAAHASDHATARAHIMHSQRIRPVLNQAIPWLAVRTRLDLAKAHLALADPAGARTLTLEVRDVMTRRPKLGVLGPEADALHARLEQVRGGSPSASTLTIAELRLLPLLSTHLTFREIGERLFVSANTVKSQAISIYRKLDATSRSEAIERAAQAGLIDRAV